MEWIEIEILWRIFSLCKCFFNSKLELLYCLLFIVNGHFKFSVWCRIWHGVWFDRSEMWLGIWFGAVIVSQNHSLIPTPSGINFPFRGIRKPGQWISWILWLQDRAYAILGSNLLKQNSMTCNVWSIFLYGGLMNLNFFLIHCCQAIMQLFKAWFSIQRLRTPLLVWIGILFSGNSARIDENGKWIAFRIFVAHLF